MSYSGKRYSSPLFVYGTFLILSMITVAYLYTLAPVGSYIIAFDDEFQNGDSASIFDPSIKSNSNSIQFLKMINPSFEQLAQKQLQQELENQQKISSSQPVAFESEDSTATAASASGNLNSKPVAVVGNSDSTDSNVIQPSVQKINRKVGSQEKNPALVGDIISLNASNNNEKEEEEEETTKRSITKQSSLNTPKRSYITIPRFLNRHLLELYLAKSAQEKQADLWLRQTIKENSFSFLE